MLVKFDRSIPGENAANRGFIEGREFDWPMTLINKFRADYGQDILVPSGSDGERIERMSARKIQCVGGKLSRQERMVSAGLLGDEGVEGRESAVAEAMAQMPEAPQAPQVEDAAPEPGTEPPVVRRGPGRPRKAPEAVPAG